jgi:sporulation related protein
MAKRAKGSGEEPIVLGEAPFEEEGPIEAEEQLALADGEERLPWLESDDDYEQPGVDTGRIVAFAAVGLLAVVLLLGALWWFTGDRTDEELVADGSVIEAPDEPYRTRPDDPGGQQVAGTGDTSFEVGEGQSVEGQIAGSGDVPAPSIDREQTGAATAKPGAAAGSVGVQVGAYSTRAQAETGWSQLSGRIEALRGRNHRIVQGTADSGTIYRLQALASTANEADTLCRTIKSQGGDCQVKR